MSAPISRTVGILIFEDVEVLDFCGPFEAFSVARPHGETSDESRLFKVGTIAETNEIISCRGGLLVQPHHTIHDHPPLDIIVIPGGRGTNQVIENQVVLDWIAAQAAKIELTTSVCTGAFLLAKVGLLDGKAATTHWGSIDWLRDNFPQVDVRDDARFVDHGNVISSAGVSAGIDMSLHVIGRLYGQDTADWTARHMEYDSRAEVLAGR